jgi:UrcA family protein
MKITNTNASPRIDFCNAFTAAFAAACLGLMATVSQAADTAPGIEPAKKVVQYGDLNLSNATAVQRLYQRIVSAARQVCDDRSGPRPLEEQVRTRICIAQSVERAVTAVNHPALTMLYDEKTGRTSTPPAVLANRH